MAVTGAVLSPSLAAALTRKGAADSFMFAPSMNAWPGAGLVISRPPGGPIIRLSG